jgi:hypothetical protein
MPRAPRTCGTILNKIKYLQTAWSYCPALCSHPVPYAALNQTQKVWVQSAALISPSGSRNILAAGWGKRKRRRRKKKSPDNVTLVGGYVHLKKKCSLNAKSYLVSFFFLHFCLFLKPEREFDPNKHCGVLDPETKKPCTRSLTCKVFLFP